MEDRPKSQPEARAGNPFLQAEWVTRNLTLELTTVHILQRQMPGVPGILAGGGRRGMGETMCRVGCKERGSQVGL